MDITVDYKNGQVVPKRVASRSPPVDPQITQTRIWEKKYHRG